ncbi:lmo0937 family membrane protein [Massilia oculi]|uniref:Lmo0937 family membrane protein n=1 Tax=Massilia hydrophila TaxID=3044279 RepID=A0ABS7Y721_9BURK|nr:lmo0937 family membrane protein [Massilia oculi]MCA1854892.1 lmo0937 family membrane protein [Massilia oculi]
MLYTIAIILLVLWLLGLATSVAGGLIHILLVAAVVVILIRLFTGKKVL